MSRNYFKLRQFKKDVLVFFDDDNENSILVALNKIENLNVHENEISVYRHPVVNGPWLKMRSII